MSLENFNKKPEKQTMLSEGSETEHLTTSEFKQTVRERFNAELDKHEGIKGALILVCLEDDSVVCQQSAEVSSMVPLLAALDEAGNKLMGTLKELVESCQVPPETMMAILLKSLIKGKV